MLTLADLRPGDIGFGPLSGAAKLAMWGQFILGEGFSVGPLNIGHVFIVTGVDNSGPFVVEAMPRGAREIPLNDLTRWTDRYAYVRLPEDYPGQAADAAAIARAMIGTPYSFLSYAALAMWRIESWIMRKSVGSTTWRGEDRPGMGSKLEKWINRRVPSEVFFPSDDASEFRGIDLPAEAICSVLADQAWSLAGKSVMQGVAHQCVTPGALAGRLLTYPDARWIWPGVS